jgi:hypothetical protein
MPESSATPEAVPAGWRFYVGISLSVLSLIAPVFIPLVAATGLSTELKTAISGLLVVGVPQVLMVGAIAVLGKPGFQFIKQRAFGFLKKFGPPREVSRARYRVGLVMFFVPLAIGWLAPYLAGRVPGYADYRIPIGICGDVLFLASLFVLGGEFWDKLRSLFVHEARVRFPEPAAEVKNEKGGDHEPGTG